MEKSAVLAVTNKSRGIYFALTIPAENIPETVDPTEFLEPIAEYNEKNLNFKNQHFAYLALFLENAGLGIEDFVEKIVAALVRIDGFSEALMDLDGVDLVTDETIDKKLYDMFLAYAEKNDDEELIEALQNFVKGRKRADNENLQSFTIATAQGEESDEQECAKLCFEDYEIPDVMIRYAKKSEGVRSAKLFALLLQRDFEAFQEEVDALSDKEENKDEAKSETEIDNEARQKIESLIDFEIEIEICA